MKEFFKKHRRVLLSTSTILLIVLLVGLNFLFPYLMQTSGAYPDMTPEGLYTLTPKMKETCAALKGDVTITFCDDPDRLLAFTELRYVYIMALQLQKLYDHIHVETVNLSENPTAVNRFKTTSASVIEPRDVIVSSGDRYRIYDSSSFWTIGSNSTSDTDYFSFNGEFKLATALLSVTWITEPIVCFTYGHGETIYVDEKDTENAHLLPYSAPNGEGRAFYDLVRRAGLKVKYVNLDTDEIDKDCVLLVTNGPTEDYPYSDPTSVVEVNALTKIHSFLSRLEMGSWMFFKDPDVSLPNLEDLAADWGVKFENGSYIRGTKDDTIPDDTGKRQKLIVTLNPDEDATPYSVFGELIQTGVPPRMVVEDSGYVSQSWMSGGASNSGLVNVYGYCFDFMYSGDKSIAVNKDGDQTVTGARAYSLAALSMRMRLDNVEDTTKFSYFFGAASTSLTSNAYLEDAAYSNYDVLFATVRFISRVDEYASMELGGTSVNSSSIGGKPLVPVKIPATGYEYYDYKTGKEKTFTALSDTAATAWSVMIVLVPAVAAGVTGTVIMIKRKNR